MSDTTNYGSIQFIQDALERLGYTTTKLTLNDSAYTRFNGPKGQSWLTQDARIGYPFTTATAVKISRDKYLAHELAAQLGVSSPDTVRVVGRLSETEMRELLHRAPLVVKPSSSSLSNGVTLQVRTLPMLENALAVAHAFSPIALVQTQAEGDEIRFVVLKGKVRAALLRQTPRVVGDGKHTVAQLINIENDERAGLTMPYLSYPQLDESLIDFDDIDLEEILAEGEVLELSRATMIKTGASVYNVMEQVDESYIALAEKMASALSARFIVVDVIVQDYKQPLTDTNYAFIEFNTAPVMKLFYSCRDGKHYDIIQDLAPMIDASLTIE